MMLLRLNRLVVEFENDVILYDRYTYLTESLDMIYNGCNQKCN